MQTTTAQKKAKTGFNLNYSTMEINDFVLCLVSREFYYYEKAHKNHHRV